MKTRNDSEEQEEGERGENESTGMMLCCRPLQINLTVPRTSDCVAKIGANLISRWSFHNTVTASRVLVGRRLKTPDFLNIIIILFVYLSISYSLFFMCFSCVFTEFASEKGIEEKKRKY